MQSFEGYRNISIIKSHVVTFCFEIQQTGTDLKLCTKHSCFFTQGNLISSSDAHSLSIHLANQLQEEPRLALNQDQARRDLGVSQLFQ